ncbi:MAG: family cation/multidrug efflux pump, partial [Bacteroidetes bacterium]|nr:family cation/multidrug efflux pump [Bacteroidota bacterium]
MALSTLSIRRPVTILMFYAGVAFAGIAGLHQLSVDFLPPVAVPRMSIITTCPNLSPEDVDERVSQPLSSVLGTVPGVTKSSSSSRAGTSLITLAFSWGVDMEFATLGVREKLDQCTADLPREVGRPTILRVDPAAEPIVTIGVSLTSSHARGDVVDLAGLTETCNALLKKRLEQVEGVAQAEVLGGVEREIRVELDETKLMALGLTVEEVARAVHRENVDLPGGTIRKGSLRYPVRLRGELNSATQIARLSFTNRGSGRRIRMTEISTVRDTIEERRGWTRYNGKDIMVLQVRKEAGSNTLAVSENVRQALTRLEREYSGLRLHILDDQAEFIRNSVADVEQSILWGASLAFIVLFLFLSGVRDPCIVGLTMPVSILATLAAMSALDISLNVISLTGLALGIGMLGDNAIIVIEN